MTWEIIHWLPGTKVPNINFGNHYNIAPTQIAPVLRLNEDGEGEACLLKWGLIPSWSKDIKMAAALINARAETVATKPSFRSAYKRKRCLIPASGFYEWQKLEDGKKKQPYYIHTKTKQPLFFAGLWESWQPDGEKLIESFTIITTSANKFMSQIHDRMPVILTPEAFEIWLSPLSKPENLQEMLKPCPEEYLSCYKVSTFVNSPKNDTPECIIEDK